MANWNVGDTFANNYATVDSWIVEHLSSLHTQGCWNAISKQIVATLQRPNSASSSNLLFLISVLRNSFQETCEKSPTPDTLTEDMVILQTLEAGRRRKVQDLLQEQAKKNNGSNESINTVNDNNNDNAENNWVKSLRESTQKLEKRYETCFLLLKRQLFTHTLSENEFSSSLAHVTLNRLFPLNKPEKDSLDDILAIKYFPKIRFEFADIIYNVEEALEGRSKKRKYHTFNVRSGETVPLTPSNVAKNYEPLREFIEEYSWKEICDIMNGYLRATEKILIGVYKRSESGLASMAKCSSMTVVDKIIEYVSRSQ